jgi:sugar phosphate isomerase/epimerase
MKKLSLNGDSLYKKYGAEKSGAFIKEAGFDALDFSFKDLSKDNHPFLENDYLQIAHNIRESYDKAGIVVNQAHAPYSFPLEKYLDGEFLDKVIYPRIIRSMEMASVLGAETIIVHPIHYRGTTKEDAFLRNMKFYEFLIPYCEKWNIKIAVENMWDRDPRRGHIIHDTCSTKEEFVRYIDGINNPFVVACLDVGHVGLPRQEDEAHDFVYALGKKRLKALHLHDNNYKGDDHLLPFRGKLDWDSLGKALGEIDYDGDFTYELVDDIFFSSPESLIPSVLKFYFDVLKYIYDVADSYRK